MRDSYLRRAMKSDESERRAPGRVGAQRPGSALSRPVLGFVVVAALFGGMVPAAEAQTDRPARETGQHVESAALEPLARRLAADVADLVTAPSRMTRRDWERAAAAVAIIVAATAIDEDIHDGIGGPENAELDELARAIRPLGQEGGIAIVGGLWVAGRISGNEQLHAMGRDGAEALLLSAGVITPALKVAFGRSRPRDGDGSATLGGGGSSFPSGEATEAFTIAAVIAAHAERRWVDWLCWSLASAVAWQRMRLDAHWSSDVIGGALIGASVGRWVVHRNRAETERAWTVAPTIGDGTYGIVARIRF